MRFVYNWKTTETMSDAVIKKFDEVEDPVIATLDLDPINVWWVPLGEVKAFRFTDDFNAARSRNGRVYEYPATFHVGITPYHGVFFVEYDQSELALQTRL